MAIVPKKYLWIEWILMKIIVTIVWHAIHVLGMYMYVDWFNFHNNLVRYYIIIIYEWGIWGSELLSNLPNITQIMSGGSRTEISGGGPEGVHCML